MKVKLLTSRAGPGLAQTVGEVIDLPDAEAKRLIEAGQAVPERRTKTEKAVAEAPERTSR